MAVSYTHLQQHAKAYGNGRITYRIYKNYPTGKVTTLDRLATSNFRCEEKNEEPVWTLSLIHILIFDGAMSHARVYMNGQEAGYWPYGYNSFYVDATPYLKPGEKRCV